MKENYFPYSKTETIPFFWIVNQTNPIKLISVFILNLGFVPEPILNDLLAKNIFESREYFPHRVLSQLETSEEGKNIVC